MSDTDSKPTGGFPPIYLCENIGTSEEDRALFNIAEDTKTRQYASNKKSIKASDVINKRKASTPFLNLI